MNDEFYRNVARRRWPNLDEVGVKNTASLVKDILENGTRYVCSADLRAEVIEAARDEQEAMAKGLPNGEDQQKFWDEFRRLHKMPEKK